MADRIKSREMINGLIAHAQNLGLRDFRVTRLDHPIHTPGYEFAFAGQRVRLDDLDFVHGPALTHLTDKMLAAVTPPPSKAGKDLVDYPDHEMVMEMIRRGYAVMKLPEDGGPPEALR